MSDVFEYLANAGQSAPSADNTQPWLFTLEDRTLSLYLDLEKIKPSCFNTNNPAILLAIGAVIENILQAANWIGTEIIYNCCLDLKTGLCATFEVRESDIALTDNAKDHPLFSRCTNRLPFIKRPIPENVLTETVDTSSSEIKFLIFQNKQQISQWSKWMRIASEVRFQTPYIHEWFGQSLKFTHEEVSSNEGLDVNTLGLPAIGKIVLKATQTWSRMKILNKFGIYKLIAKIEGEKIKDSPALIGIAAPLNDISAIETGRLMERTWIKLNAAGISVQPYFVISDQLYRLKQQEISRNFIDEIKSVETDLKGLLDDKFLYMLLRIGYCNQQPIRSRRRQISFNTFN